MPEQVRCKLAIVVASLAATSSFTVSRLAGEVLGPALVCESCVFSFREERRVCERRERRCRSASTVTLC